MSDRKVTTTLRLSEGTREALKAAAAQELRSMSNVVELACRRWLAERSGSGEKVQLIG